MGLFDFFKKNKDEKRLPETKNRTDADVFIHHLPYFGQIDLNDLQEDYRTNIKLDGKDLSIDINFKNKTIHQDEINKVHVFLENITKFDKQNMKGIESDFKDSGETTDYIQFYIDELDEDELSNIIDIKKGNKGKQLLSKLKLIRVGLYPDGKYDSECFGVFDYSIDIDGEPCNQLLVINTDEKGNLDHITWES